MPSRLASSFATNPPAALSSVDKDEWQETLAALTELEAFLGQYPSHPAGRTIAMGDWAAIKQEQPLQNYRALPDQLSRMRKALVDLEKWAEVLVVGRRARASAAAAAEKGKGKWMERVEGGRVAK